MDSARTTTVQRRQFLATVGVAGLGGCVSVSRRTGRPLSVSSPALTDGGDLARRFTCDGAGDSPPFVVESVPGPTASLMVTGTVNAGLANQSVLWTLWNVPPERERIPAGLPREATLPDLGGARQGTVRLAGVGYKPPCPPPGKRYEFQFQVYALDTTLDVEAGATNESAVEATEGHVLASERITVGYRRTQRA